jgi:transcriptional regulator with XRE-family HTH domain
MAPTNEIQEFLTSRRARLTPEQVGLQSYGRRRVPGLRREEVAMLARVSVDYYGRLERGNLSGVSEGVLRALVDALRLTGDEERHLRDLIAATGGPVQPQRKRPESVRLRPSLQRMLDALEPLPALIYNGRLDIVTANRMGRGLFIDHYDTSAPPPNFARFMFLDPRSRTFNPNWDQAADDTVAMLRTEVGRDPHDRRLSDLIGELATRSNDFKVRWAAHNVKQHRSGTKTLQHRAVGALELDFEVIALEGDRPLSMSVFSAEPGSPADDGLQLLARWVTSELDLGAVHSGPEG